MPNDEAKTEDTTAEQESSSIMRSIQHDLEDVEHQLESPGGLSRVQGHRGGGGGSSFFNSIRSALGSIRTRLENLQESEQQQQPRASAASAAGVGSAESKEQESNSSRAITPRRPSAGATMSSVGQRLMDRLRNAELANSARIPLNVLQSELDRRRQQSGGSNSDASMSRSRFGNKRDRENERKVEEDARDTGGENEVKPPSSGRVPRRTSMLLASRRRAAEVEGPQVDMDLHGTASTLQASIRQVGDSVEVVMEEAEEKSQEEGEEVPRILLPKSSHSKLDLTHRSVLFPEVRPEPSTDMDIDLEQQPTPKSSTVVYSWGTGVNSLHSGSADIPLAQARVDPTSRVGRTDIVACAIGKHHIGCVTAAGEVLMAGNNTSGEVDPDRREEKTIAKPVRLESLFQATVVQVSCGANHTAALRSNGTILTWGSNEFGQLGHRNGAKAAAAANYVRPAVMALGPGQRATSVACGDGFTLCLTSRMSLLACGVEDVTGLTAEEERRLPSFIPALEDLPLVSISAGRRHAVAVTAHGSAFTWGDNSTGACGREYPKKFAVPVPFKPPATSSAAKGKTLPEPLTNWVYHMEEGPSQKCNASLSDDVAVVQAACGDEHTVLVTRAGGLLVCGSNKHGQIGLDPDQVDTVYHPRPVDHPDTRREFKRAEAGESHTLLLDNFGDVWQLGGTEEKRVGCQQVFVAKMIQSIAAGGKQNVVVATGQASKGPLRRELSDSITTNDGELVLVDCLEEVIRKIPEEPQAGSDAHSKIAKSAEELFRTPAVLNSLFLDPTELEDLFSKLLNVDAPNFRRRITLAIEKGMQKGLDNLRSDDTRLTFPEQVRFLLLYVQCPLFIDWKKDDSVFDRRGDLILSLCETILELNYEGYRALMAWATSIYPRERFVRFLVQPLLSQLKKGLSVEAGAERRPIPAIVSVLRWLYNASERGGNIASPEDFISDAVSSINPEALLKDLQRYKAANNQQRAAEFFICDNPFLLSPSCKRNLLYIENEMNMMKVAAQGITYNAEERAFEFNPFFVLEVDREHLFTQTLQKLPKVDSKDLRKKLRVVFKGEDGIDGKLKNELGRVKRTW